MENPIKTDDLGVPLFLETPKSLVHCPLYPITALLNLDSLKVVQFGRHAVLPSYDNQNQLGIWVC